MVEARIEESSVDADRVIARAHDWFRRNQFGEGYWWAELESNATMDAEYILMTHFIGERNDAIWRGIAQDIRSYQRDDGTKYRQRDSR